MKVCSVDGCSSRAVAKGLCKTHHNRWRSKGILGGSIITKRVGDPTPEFFKKYSTVDEATGCWNWNRTISSDGYGHVQVNKVGMHASRASFVASNGPIPRGLLVCHKCDNRLCVNPDHLWIGTAQDNQDDMRVKGRAHYCKGEECKYAKLNYKKAAEIRSDPRIHRLIAADYGVTRRLIGRIKEGKLWKI